jgi:ribokinase
MPHIVIVGSLNMDLVVEVPLIPQPGETVLGKNFATFPGGKGANQAVAAARLGADVTMIGRVGADEFGEQLLDSARREGIDVSQIGIDDHTATGVAMIAVDASGQNSIAVASGANFRLTAQNVRQGWRQLTGIDLLVMPLETPLETIRTAILLAKESNVRVVLNPAPAQKLPLDILSHVDVLVPNEPETAQLTGLPLETDEDTHKAAQHLLAQGVGSVVLTLGSRGALVLDGTGSVPEFTHVAPYDVAIADTTAAGDAFVAALAVSLGEGASLVEATRFANACGALTVTKTGAQPSLPWRNDVESLIQSNT